jgi:hypothetical protein
MLSIPDNLNKTPQELKEVNKAAYAAASSNRADGF